MVDQLASEYADRPVVFVEDDVDRSKGHRRDRWWAGYGGGGSVYLPLVMVASGHRVSTGPVSYRAVYSGLVDDELDRPAAAEVAAYSRQIGNTLRIYVRAVNRSAASLSAAANGAAVEAIVWEDKRVHTTARTVRCAPWASLEDPVAPGEAVGVVLDTIELPAVDWARLRAVAFVDYRPAGATGAYDMLQAALAVPADLLVTPADIAVDLATLGPGGDAGTLELRGPHVLEWTAASDALWLKVSPGEGVVPGTVTVVIDRGALPAGVSQGHLTFVAASEDGLSFTREVTVRVDAAGPAARLRRRLLHPG